MSVLKYLFTDLQRPIKVEVIKRSAISVSYQFDELKMNDNICNSNNYELCN